MCKVDYATYLTKEKPNVSIKRIQNMFRHSLRIFKNNLLTYLHREIADEVHEIKIYVKPNTISSSVVAY